MPVLMKNREWIKESQPIYVQESKLWFSVYMLVWNKIYTHKLYLELWQHFSLFFRSGKYFAYILNQYTSTWSVPLIPVGLMRFYLFLP